MSREIRRLADQTAAATLDIEQMVQQMQAAVSEGVMEMDHFADQGPAHGVQGVEEISRQMEEIIERVRATRTVFPGASVNMQSQAQNAGQISRAMAADGKRPQTTESISEYCHAANDLRGDRRPAVIHCHLSAENVMR